MKSVRNENTVFKEQSEYSQQEEENTLCEPEAIYASALNDMMAVSG